MPPTGEHSEAPAFTGEVHGRRDREADPTTEAERALKGGTPGGHSAVARFSASGGTDSPGRAKL